MAKGTVTLAGEAEEQSITGDTTITGKLKVRKGQAFINDFHHSWVMGG
jgi:hypothetical protein